MTKLGLILSHRLLAIFALALIRLKPILTTPRTTEKFIFANLAGTVLDCAGG